MTLTSSQVTTQRTSSTRTPSSWPPPRCGRSDGNRSCACCVTPRAPPRSPPRWSASVPDLAGVTATSWVRVYDAAVLDPLAEQLTDLAGIGAGMHVLDVLAGRGRLTR